MVDRFKGSGRMQEGGFLATHKQDFNAHHTGGDWRHGAPDIDMEPTIDALPGANVQQVFENLSAILTSSGTGFVSIGNIGPDGYAQGAYNVGSTATPTLPQAFAAAFADKRLTNGGVVLLVAGTYNITTEIVVPAGITIMGEGAGTIISGEMSAQSMFKLLAATDFPNMGGDLGSGPLSANAINPVDETKILNLIIADDIDGYAGSKTTGNSTMQTVPMIEIEVGSRVHIENVKFLGRVNNEAVTGRGKTLRAIGYSGSSSAGSSLTLKRCFFDGMETAARFTPGNGDLDYLVVDQCKARTFGTEDISALEAENNCFVSMTLCNAILTNNNFIGFGTFPAAAVVSYFVVSSGATGAGGSDVNVVVTGNTGAPSSGVDAKSIYYDGTLSLSLKAAITGNNWGSALNNNWFVTVGFGTAVTSDSGDFTGTGAIDLVLAAAFEYPTTVIVNKGTYEVTSTGDARYNFIGNGDNAEKPVFDMNLGPGAPTDDLGNRTFTVGEKVENIRFRSSTASTGTTEFHSIRPNPSSDRAFVRNCDFINCTLSYEDSLDHIVTVDCDFSQNNTLDDNLGLLAPRADYVLLEGCTFTGNGYAGHIGVNSIGFTYSTGTPSETGTVVVRDCVMDLTGSTIDDAIVFLQSYFRINGANDASEMKVFIENCQFLADNTFAQRLTALSGGVAFTFNSWVLVLAKEVYVDNCILHAPTQDVGFGPCAAMSIIPGQNVRVTNSRFVNGGVPLKIGGGGLGPINNSGISGDEAQSVVVDGCTFKVIDGYAMSNTLLDIDLDPATLPTSPQVVVSNNNFALPFQATPGPGLIEVFHSDIDGPGYTAHGIVQIYARDFDINVHNNTIVGDLDQTMPTGFDHVSGLVINNFDDDAAADGDRIAPINVSNNRILVRNEFTSAFSQETATALWVKGTAITVNGNHLSMNNIVATSGSFIGCMYLENRNNATGGAPGPSLVTGNTFSRRNQNGVATTLNRAYILIPSTVEADGIIVDNVFSDPTLDGTDTTTLEDNSSGTIWKFDRNKNQTIVRSLKVSAFDPSDETLWGGGFFGSVQQLTTGPTSNAYWQFTTLPHGAEITRIRVGVRAGGGHGALPAPGDIAEFRLQVGSVSGGTHGDATTTPASPFQDASANVAAYELYHFIDTGTFSVTHTVDNVNETLLLSLAAETGVNAVSGLEYRFVEVTMILP